MKRSHILGGLSAILMASAALYAAPGDMKAKIDTDGNGAVSKSKSLAASDKMFARMDVNSDGKVDAADREAKLKQHFAKIDTDNNGAISQTEFLAMHANRGDRAGAPDGKGERMGHRGGKGRGGHGMGMKMADANGDKVITQAEFRTAAEARFAKADANNDGSISADERKAGHKGMWKGHRGPKPGQPPMAPPEPEGN